MISPKDILMGYLGWISIGYLGISWDILGYLGISWLDIVYRDVAKRYPESIKISIDILSSPTNSQDILRSPMGRTPRWLPSAQLRLIFDLQAYPLSQRVCISQPQVHVI